MRRTYITLTITIVLGFILIILLPYYAITPGVLINDHENLKNDCFSCHTLGQGVVTQKCINCHKLSEIGSSLINTASQNKRSNLIHKSIKDIQCYDCHTEHKGESRKNATLKFTHDVLSKEILSQCSDCHTDQNPNDFIHTPMITNCVGCHTTSEWKLISFNHELLGDKKNICQSCHSKNIPTDELHRSLSTSFQCMQCHSTTSWKPSTFDHAKYFKFDENHPSNCSGCHDSKANFKSYTCYNCHEHNQQRITEKHIDEGIRNFKDCVRCHRSGNEHVGEVRESKQVGDDE